MSGLSSERSESATRVKDDLTTGFLHELYWTIVTSDVGEVDLILREMSEAGVTVADLPKLCSGSLVGNCIVTDREEVTPEAWITWSHLARETSTPEMEQKLLAN